MECSIKVRENGIQLSQLSLVESDNARVEFSSSVQL